MTARRSELSVVTVLFGGAETLELTLPSWAEAASDLPVSFLFVDNSEDEAARAVVEAQPWGVDVMRYVHSGANLGFAAGANRAVLEADADAVLLLNPDVVLTADALRRLLSLAPTNDPRAVSLVTDGRVFAGIEVGFSGWFSDRPVSSRRRCIGPSGGAALFDRVQFERSGGFTDALFAWGEDAALALRLWQQGVRTEIVDLRLEHSGGHSVASTGGLRKKALWLARNRVWILRAQFSGPYRATIGVLMLGMIVVNGLRKVRSRTARAYFTGVLLGLTTPPPWRISKRVTLRSHLAYLSEGRFVSRLGRQVDRRGEGFA